MRCCGAVAALFLIATPSGGENPPSSYRVTVYDDGGFSPPTDLEGKAASGQRRRITVYSTVYC